MNLLGDGGYTVLSSALVVYDSFSCIAVTYLELMWGRGGRLLLICVLIICDSLSYSADNLLGDGGFGNVYQLNHLGQETAVKIFSAIGDIHPHKMLRQEVRQQL